MGESSPAASSQATSSQMRTLAVRVNDDLRSQLDVIAQLNSRSVTEEIRIALETWIETSRSDPKVLQRAESVRADIEREAKTRQSAIEAIFGAESGGSEGSPGQGGRHRLIGSRPARVGTRSVAVPGVEALQTANASPWAATPTNLVAASRLPRELSPSSRPRQQ